MKYLGFWLTVGLIAIMSLAISALNEENQELLPVSFNESEGEGEEVSTLLRHHRRHSHHRNSHKKMTCNKFPRVCRKKGSPGKYCCKKKCVDVRTDRRNCGWCGHKCRYSEICCKGRCVNPKWDKKNCGGCNIKCKKGCKCQYGMCSYA